MLEEGHRIGRHPLCLQDLLGGEAALDGDLLDGGFAAQRAGQSRGGTRHLGNGLDHVHRHPDGAALVGDGAADGLADPPSGVGGELEALAVLELLDGADQAEVALLHEVEQRQTGGLVALGDRDHEPQVRLDEALLGLLSGGPLGFQAASLRRRERRRARDLVGRAQAGLHDLGQLDFVGRGEQLVLADLFEVLAHQVLHEVGVAAARHSLTPG